MLVSKSFAKQCEITHRFTAPRLQRLTICTKICINNFGNDVLSQLAMEPFDIECRIHRPQNPCGLSSLVLIEEGSYSIRDRPHAGHERILGFIVRAA